VLKPLFPYYKWVLHELLSLTAFPNSVSVSSNFNTAFLPDCSKFFNAFLCHWIGDLIRISKMCLKQSLSYYKWVLFAILSLTVLSNYRSVISNFDTAFLPYCSKFCVDFLGYWIENLIRIPKMCLKQSLFYYKWVFTILLLLQAILSLTDLLNCLSVS